MLFKAQLNSIVIIIIISTNCVLSEFVIASLVGTAIAATGLFGWKTIKSHTYCRFKECCDEKYINFDLDSKFIQFRLF